MEYKLLEAQEALLMNEFVDDMHTQYDDQMICSFLKERNALGFIVKEDGKIIGFAYGYLLNKPDGRKDFYLHSIDVMKKYQGCGYGTGLMEYIQRHIRSIGCRKMFLITDKSNEAACSCYEKAGGETRESDDVVYVFKSNDI